MLIKKNSSAVKCLQWQDTSWRAAGLTITSTTTDGIVCHAGVLFRQDRHSKGDSPQELGVLLGSVHSTVWTTGLQKGMCTVGAKGHHRHKTLHYTLDSLPDNQSRVCSALLQHLKHGLITRHPNPAKNPGCGNTNHPQAKKVWSNKDGHGNCLLDLKGVHLVDFLDCGDDVTA